MAIRAKGGEGDVEGVGEGTGEGAGEGAGEGSGEARYGLLKFGAGGTGQGVHSPALPDPPPRLSTPDPPPDHPRPYCM